MKRIFVTFAVGTIAAAAFAAAPAPAYAQSEKENPLDGQPAVRHRMKLVEKRFEVTPAFESSLNAEFRHTIGAGLKLEYHLPSAKGFTWSIGAVGFFGTSFNTGLVTRIINTLPDASMGDPTPTKQQYESHLNKISTYGAAYVTLTPWYGKLAAFGKAFVNFDFYFSAGIAFAQLKSSCSNTVCTDMNPGVIDPANNIFPDDNPNNDPPLNGGTRLGLFLGGGIHVFLNNFIALDLTVRDYFFSNNPSGLDFDADLAVTDKDSRLLHHLFVGIGISFFLPMKIERTP